jgi:uncharacterized protein
MPLLTHNNIQAKIPELLEQVPYLRLLVLFGSRARGSQQADSDFAMLFDEDLRQEYELQEGWDRYRSWMIWQNLLDLGDDEMDGIDLKDASELLAHAIVQDGMVIYEHEPVIFDNFCQAHLKSAAELRQISQATKERIQDKLKALRALNV